MAGSGNTVVDPTPKATQELSKEDAPLTVVELRKKQSRKNIRKLRKGRGKLIDKVNETLLDLRANSAVQGNVQPVVIVVRQKKKKSGRWRLKF